MNVQDVQSGVEAIESTVESLDRRVTELGQEDKHHGHHGNSQERLQLPQDGDEHEISDALDLIPPHVYYYVDDEAMVHTKTLQKLKRQMRAMERQIFFLKRLIRMASFGLGMLCCAFLLWTGIASGLVPLEPRLLTLQSWRRALSLSGAFLALAVIAQCV